MNGARKPRCRWSIKLASLGLLSLTIVASGCGQAPQLGSEEALGAADALWTAVTAKDPDLIERSDRSIKALHEKAKLNDEAFAVLQSVITTARAGAWDDARNQLKTFVKGQRPVEKKP